MTTTPPDPRWEDVNTFVVAVQKLAEERSGDRPELLQRWNARLELLGGDPSGRDWRRFRPLRLSREEDWSDWLAHLLETSPGCRFARKLFGPLLPPSDRETVPVRLEVGREVRLPGRRAEDVDRRADIVFDWSQSLVVHIEVKIDDRNFVKTFETAERLQGERPRSIRWAHVLLIPERVADEWSSIANDPQHAKRPKVQACTWTQVAISIRQALAADGDRDMAWKAWAWTFCGAVEQRILGHPRSNVELGPGGLLGAMDQIRVLRAGESGVDT